MADLSRDGQNAHPGVVASDANAVRALNLRIQAYSYRQIADELGVSVATAHRLVNDALEETREQKLTNADDLRRMELARIDMLINRMVVTLPKAVPTCSRCGATDTNAPCPGSPSSAAQHDMVAVMPAVDPSLMNSILKAIEARRKLLGIDAPIRWEGSGPGGGPLPIAAGLMDLTKLTVDELRALEAMIVKTGTPALVAGRPVDAHDSIPPVTSAVGPATDPGALHGGQSTDVSLQVSKSLPPPDVIVVCTKCEKSTAIYAGNTHWHCDHCGMNQPVKPTAEGILPNAKTD